MQSIQNPTNDKSDSHGPSQAQWALTLAALGVVFGDIGTSPLYALRECFSEDYGIALSQENLFGLLSLIFWTMTLLVSVKYVAFVLRADNKGEGGILSLLALALPKSKTVKGHKKYVLLGGLFGAALLYGDGMITPAISVLSAVEGIKIATPVFYPFVVPLTCLILIALFFFQKFGTAKIGFIFGPVVAIYLLTLTGLGIPSIFESPEILFSLSPHYAVQFFYQNGALSFFVLGSVFLVVTGCEALYADMGHFGRKPILRGWFLLVCPALLINYFGQGALLLRSPESIKNPFYLLAPDWFLVPLVIIATCATVVASQALISGVFSLTNQAISMGFFPRLKIIHTSSSERGQIYIPLMNWILMIGTIWLVLNFKSSSNLAGAYGIAVSLTMLLTAVIASYYFFEKKHWSIWQVSLFGVTFVAIDLAFVGANLPKIQDGGWFPLVIAAGIFVLLTTWKRGRRILSIRLKERNSHFQEFLDHEMNLKDLIRIPGTAFFMVSDPDMTPPALVRNVSAHRVLHERVVILSISTDDVPRLETKDRLQLEILPQKIYRASCHFGFMETPSMEEILKSFEISGVQIKMAEIVFYLGRETLLVTDAHRGEGMSNWRKVIFAIMSKNAERATQFFKLPPDQVMEIGCQIEL